MHIYHRIYRFAQRNVEADRIALTLDLPLKTVQRVLDKFAQAKELGELDASAIGIEAEESEKQTFLDVYIVSKVRYVVADISGWATEEHCEKLGEELEKLKSSQWKVSVLLMKDTIEIDEKGMEIIIAFYNNLKSRGRYTAILDPSPRIEPFISAHQIEEKIPIFGTEKTFEDEAFSHRRGMK